MPDDLNPEDVTPRRAAPEAVGVRSQGTAEDKRGIRRNGRIAVLIGLALAAALAIWLLGPKLSGGPELPSDYTGAGKEDVIIEVKPGDSGSVIAQDLVNKDVIADVGMFISAASGNAELAAIQPGY
jgi:UPF0755 protein